MSFPELGLLALDPAFPYKEPVSSFQLFLLELCKSLIPLSWPMKLSADNVQGKMEASLFKLSLLKVK